MPIKKRNLDSALAAQITAAGIWLSPNANIFYVDSGHASTGTGKPGTDPSNPLSTIDDAIDNCTANNGDLIIVMPGHAETVADATTIVPDTAGITILGLGRGSDRPTLTLTATGSNIPISAANITLENFLLVPSGTVDVTAAITVTGTDVLLKDIEIRESAATSQVVDGIVLGATSDRGHVKGLIYRGAAGDAGASAVSVTGSVDGVLVEDFFIQGTFAAAGVETVTGSATNILIRRGLIDQRHATTDAAVTLTSDCTGSVCDVDGRSATNDDAGLTGMFVGAAAQFYRIGMVNNDAEHAAMVEVADLDVTNTRSGKTFSTIA